MSHFLESRDNRYPYDNWHVRKHIASETVKRLEQSIHLDQRQDLSKVQLKAMNDYLPVGKLY